MNSARAYADPTSATGLLQRPAESSAALQLTTSLDVLSEVLPPEKIFYLQVSDGAGSRRVAPADLQRAAAEQGISPLYAWSNAWRPLPYMDEVCPRDKAQNAEDEQGWGGYLPVAEVCEAVLKTGWRGPWSYEVRRWPMCGCRSWSSEVGGA